MPQGEVQPHLTTEGVPDMEELVESCSISHRHHTLGQLRHAERAGGRRGAAVSW
jgi:hypothetical protein